MAKKIESFRPAYLPDSAKLYGSTDKRRECNSFYASKAWREYRQWHLRQHPLCVDCQAPAVDVDHVIPRLEAPDRAFDPGNTQSMCKQCHAKKTRAERSRPRWQDLHPESGDQK